MSNLPDHFYRWIVSSSFLVLALVTATFGQEPSSSTDDFTPSVSFSEILKGLGDESVHSYFDRNRELIRAVYDRGIGFGFGSRAKEVLIKAGASEGLISVITNGQKKREEEIRRLFEEYVEVRNTYGLSGNRKAIRIIKELLDKIGNPEQLVGDERALSVRIISLKKSLESRETSLRMQTQLQPD